MADGGNNELASKAKRAQAVSIDPAELEVTEDGVALAFTARHGDTLLFDHDAGRWYEWQGDHWQPENTNRAFNCCRELARDASNRLSPKERERVRKAAFAAGVERMARADPSHAVRQSDWDADPWLLGCPGRIVDLRMGGTADPKPGDRNTRQTAVAPARTPDCPLWPSFLNDATGGDRDLIRFLQQWAGYGLTGITREHALIFLYGLGGNGKSVFLNTIAGIVGDYAVTASMDTFTSSRTTTYFDEQDLVGQWLEEKAVVEPGNLSRWENASDLFVSWTDYAKANGETAGTSKALAGKLAGKRLVSGQKKIEGQNRKVWFGISLNRPGTYHDDH